jgi:hypothetical protein
VKYVKFHSAEPLDHLPRALDTLRKMGFERCAVSLEFTPPALSPINVTYEPKRHLTRSPFGGHLRRMHDVDNLVCG